MNTQIFFIILLGFGILVIMAIILFGLDIYYLAKKSKKEKEEKDIISLKFSEGFLSELEKMINQETKKTISGISQKISDEVTKSYEKQIAVFSQEAENKIANWDEVTKKEILKFSNACSQAEDSILQEIKRGTNELSEGLVEKIDGIYQVAKTFINQKIAQTEKNIEDYKKEKLKEIDQKIYQIIEDVAKKTIGKAIDLSTHEELVIQSLEKAKKEKIL